MNSSGFGATPGQRPRLALRIREHVGVRLDQVDALKIAEVHRVGRRGPDAAEKVGIGHLQPQAAPAARRMPGQESSRRRAQTAIVPFDDRDQLLDQGLAAGAVVRRIGEHVMAQPATGIEHDMDHVHAGHVRGVALRGPESVQVRTVEAGDFIDDRVLPLDFLPEGSRQHHAGAQLHGPAMERRQQLARDIDQLDALGGLERFFGVNLIETQLDPAAARRRQSRLQGWL